jgi:hypothetical protein
VGYQLAGTKRVQQVLCEAGVLERYVPDMPYVPDVHMPVPVLVLCVDRTAY